MITCTEIFLACMALIDEPRYYHYTERHKPLYEAYCMKREENCRKYGYDFQHKKVIVDIKRKEIDKKERSFLDKLFNPWRRTK